MKQIKVNGKDITLSNVDFVELSELVPKTWAAWFYGLISEGAPFSWGDNNRTLVTVERFYDHAVDMLEDMEEEDPETVADFLSTLEKLGATTYIDLEN